MDGTSTGRSSFTGRELLPVYMYMYSRRLLLFIVWKALEYEPAFEQGDAAGRGGCRSRCSVSPGGVTAATKGGYHFPSGGLNLTPLTLTPPALRSGLNFMCVFVWIGACSTVHAASVQYTWVY